jgi:tetratricopeptide (TPR) repeat protein
MTQQRRLGEALSAALETGPSRSALAAQRAQVLAELSKPEPPLRLAWMLGAGAALVAAAAVLVPALLAERAKSELQGAWQGKSLPERSRVVAPAERGETLSFSDGSRVELGARAEIALSKLAPAEAHLELARGRVDATIRKGTGRSWTLGAGPYSVRVVGTAFSVDWDASSRFFAVKVREGKVLVTGGELRAGGVLLGPGERLERQAPPPASGATTPSTEKQAPPSPAPAAALSAEAEPAARALPSAPPSAEDDFRTQATRGNYSQAIAAARQAGFERLERELSAKDLLLLANTARYAGSPGEARGALLKLRERFPGTPSGAHAALLLASQAEDRDKNPSEAERWLRIFLTESPSGELAAGARARLLAALLRRGAQSEAEQVARDYLRLHPSGQHVAQARAVLRPSP